MTSRLALFLAMAVISSGCREQRPETPLAPTSAPAPPARTSLPDLPSGDSESPAVLDLAARLAALGNQGELRLEPGRYVLEPTRSNDVACVTCPGPNWQEFQPPITVGLRLSGKGLRIVGAGADRTVIETHSGYGVFFDGCEDCSIEGVTLTSGNRGATDAVADGAIVVRESSVRVADCVLLDNLGDGLLVMHAFVGISGIIVREGGKAVVERCRIVRCSWDGVAVLRGGEVTLSDVAIDGVDRASGPVMGGGRGVGVRIAHGGRAELDGVLIRRHAGGLSVHPGSAAIARDLIIEDSTTWGILADGAVEAPAELRVDGALLKGTAACGVLARPDGGVVGHLRGVRTVLCSTGPAGQPCTGVLSVPPGFEVEDTLSWLTGGPPGLPTDTEASAFREASRGLFGRLQGRPATSESGFLSGR